MLNEKQQTTASNTGAKAAPKYAKKQVRTVKAAQHLELNTVPPRAITFKALNKEIPNNDFGLPQYYYRADFIPSDILAQDDVEKSDTLASASVELDYGQGFPVTPTGEPFWGQLPHEPADAYRAFKAFLDLPLRDEVKGGPAAVRQMHLLQTELATTTAALLEYSYIYYWGYRSRAYDLFKAASHSKLKEQRLTAAENEHYDLACRYIAYTTEYLEGVFKDPDSNGLKPRDAMDLMLKMIQVQRLASGAAPFTNPNNNYTNPNAIPQGATLEVILRTLAQQSGMLPAAGTDPNDPNAKASLENMTRKLLLDPAALMQAQELVIKVGNTGERTRNMAPPHDDGKFE